MNSEKKPKVGSIAVVVPTFNSEKFLLETLDSISNQTHPVCEILIADDGSTDNTVKVAKAWSVKTHVPLRVLCGNVNSGGPATPINRGVAAANTEFVTIMDHDDIMEPDKIKLQLGALNANPNCGLAFCDYRHFDDSGFRPASDAKGLYPTGYRELGVEGPVTVVSPPRALSAFIRDPGLPRSSSGQMFRKAHWNRIGGYRAKMGPASDFDFAMRSLDAPVAWVNQPLYSKRVHLGNLWSTNRQTELLGIRIQWAGVYHAKLSAYSDLTTIVRHRHQRLLQSLRHRRASIFYGQCLFELLRRDIWLRGKGRVERLLPCC